MQVAWKRGLPEKQQSVPNTCDISPLKYIFFQNLTDAFFKYLYYIKLKLVIPKILFILVLSNFNFYLKIMQPPLAHTNKITPAPPPPSPPRPPQQNSPRPPPPSTPPDQKNNCWTSGKDFSKISTPPPPNLEGECSGVGWWWCMSWWMNRRHKK